MPAPLAVSCGTFVFSVAVPPVFLGWGFVILCVGAAAFLAETGRGIGNQIEREGLDRTLDQMRSVSRPRLSLPPAA